MSKPTGLRQPTLGATFKPPCAKPRPTPEATQAAAPVLEGRGGGHRFGQSEPAQPFAAGLPAAGGDGASVAAWRAMGGARGAGAGAWSKRARILATQPANS